MLGKGGGGGVVTIVCFRRMKKKGERGLSGRNLGKREGGKG